MKTVHKLNCLAAALCAFFVTQSSQAQPTITQNPQAKGFYAGKNTFLSVQATGTAPLSYQWMAGVTGSATYTNLLNAGNISGVTSSNLVITGATTANAADYVVVVTDGASLSVTSAAPATLSLIPAPSDDYGLAVLADNPVAFWRLNETGGTTANDYAGGYNGVYQGGVALNQAGAGGYTANVSTYFSGASTHPSAVIPWYPALNPPLLTVECWVAPTNLPSGAQQRKIIIGGMAQTNSSGNNTSGYYLDLEYNGAATLDHWGWTVGSGQNWTANVATSVPNGSNGGLQPLQWVYLVGVYDGTNEIIYTNGIKASSLAVPYVQNISPNTGSAVTAANSNAWPHVELGIGTLMDSSGPGAAFNGYICDAAIYNTALSSNQILAHYAQAISGGEVAPVVTQQPQSITLYAGQTATFSAQVASYLPAYQWMAGTHGSGVFTNLPSAGNITGTAAASLMISNITAANALDYVLVSTNYMGSVTSSVVTLTVQPLPTDVYGLDVLADKPAAYWRLNETTGTNAYDYAGGHNGVYLGGVTLNQTGISSFDTTVAAGFDGSSGYAQVPYSSALNTPNFTVKCWVDQTGGTGNQQAPFANQNSGAGYDFYSYPASPDQWDYQVSGTSALGTGGVAVNQWTHLAGTFDGNNQILYVNGVPVVTNQVTGFTANSAMPLNIGAGNNDQSSPAYYWTGLMNEVAVYGAALTPNQILKHYDLATTGTVPAPVITQQPQGLSLYSNLTAAFSVQAQSLVTPSYQWMAGASGSHVYTNLVNAGNVSGVTTTNLVITSISTGNAADYVVAVSSSSGSVTSSVATLTVVARPTDNYGALVLAAGPAAYWRMNETSGSVMHDYIGGHNGTYQGGVTLNQAGISTYDTNRAVLFDGASGYAQVPNSTALNTPAFSVECWLNPNSASGQMNAIGNQDSVNGSDGYDLSVVAGSPDTWNFMVGATNLSVGYTTLSGSEGQLSQWTHVVATFQNSNTVLYVNGQMVATNTPASSPTWLTPNSAWPLFVGAGNNDQSAPANYWSGLINEVAIYSSVLTPLQVQQHYAVAALGGYAPPTILQSPTNMQRYATMSASFTGQAISFLPSMTNQWMAGAHGTGIYTNLLNAGNISGVTTTNLVITNLAVANMADYVFVAQNAAGSVTSSVAYLSVQALPSDAYGATVVSNNPVGFWRLNEASGTTAHDYAGGYNGTYTSVTLNQAGAGGHTANVAALFDGTSSHNVIIPWAAALNPSLLTMECWVSLPSGTMLSGSQARHVVMGSAPNTNSASVNNTGYYLNLEVNSPTNDDRWASTLGSGQSWSSGSYNCYSSGGLKPLQWWHLVCTYDGTKETLYTNGVKASSLTVPYYPNVWPNAGPNVTSANSNAWPYVPLGIGSLMNCGGPGAGFNGYICDAAIYNYALNGYQVLNQYTVAETGAGVPAPVFTLQPQSVTTNAGSTVSFTGQASFAQPLTYQWMVLSNGVYVNLANGGSISGATTTNLVISSAVVANATNYVLVASYPGVSVTSSAATLTVTPPVFTLQPQSVTTNAGSTVSFTGQASFAQPLTYQWMVLSNGVYVNLANGGSISGATTTNLVIASVVVANATNYVLVAAYAGVSVTSSAATLTVTAPLPISLVSTYANGAVTLNWTNAAYTLMRATNVAGPWIRATNLSGYQVSATNSQMYFRLVY